MYAIRGLCFHSEHVCDPWIEHVCDPWIVFKPSTAGNTKVKKKTLKVGNLSNLKTLKVGKTRLVTQKLDDSKLASPPFLYFRAPFLCIHHE